VKNIEIWYKMKIAIVTPNSGFVGGVEVFNGDISRISEETGHSVSIVSKESLSEIPERDLESAVGERFNELNKEEQYDLVICNGEFGYKVEHPRAINVFHGNYYGHAMALKDLVPPEQTERMLVKSEMQRESAEGKYVVTVSNFSVQGLNDSGIDVDQVINNSVNPNKFYPRDLEISNTALAVCRGMKYRKGFDILENLAKRGINIKLFSDRTISYPNVENRGLVNNGDLPEEYGQAQLFLNPTRFEGGELTTLEAMACGCPVLTTPVGFGFDIKNEIPNFVASPDDIDELMAKYNILVNNREEYSEKALDYFTERHNPETFRSEWIDLIEGMYGVDSNKAVLGEVKYE
jgi:glycosyltransferase involved in cell wall biosynthesis